MTDGAGGASGYRMWGRRGASLPCPDWWGRGLWGRWFPSVGVQPPVTGASWWPHPAPRRAPASSPPPQAGAGSGPAAGLEMRGRIKSWVHGSQTFTTHSLFAVSQNTAWKDLAEAGGSETAAEKLESHSDTPIINKVNTDAVWRCVKCVTGQVI